MKTLSAKDAKYGFGRLIDLARGEPVVLDALAAVLRAAQAAQLHCTTLRAAIAPDTLYPAGSEAPV